MGLASAPMNLDPRFATDATSERINKLLYESLVEFDESSLPIPALATWQKLTPTIYRISLQNPLSIFSDGGELIAEDVKATYDSVLNPKNASPLRSAIELIKEIRILNKVDLEFVLKRPDPLFPAYLALGILPKKAIEAEHAFHESPLGSGAYSLEQRQADGGVVLRRRADSQRLELIPVKDPTVRTLKLLRGEIDLLQNNLPPELFQYLSQRSGIKVERRAGSNFTYIGFNLGDADVGNIIVRKAIALAIDRAAIIHFVLDGAATPAESLLPPDHWAGGKNLPVTEYNPEKAKALLGSLGYSPDNPLSLVYKTSTDPFRVRLATIIQHQLAEVGIQLAVRSYDWGTFFGDIKSGRFQMYSLSWVGIKTPDVFRYVFHSDSLPPRGANRGRFKNDKVDQLIESAEQAEDRQLQAMLYQQLQAVLHTELPYIPLWYEDQVLVQRDNVSGYTLAGDGNYQGLLDVKKSVSSQLETVN